MIQIAIEHGLRVFPCAPGGKRPLTENGCKDATNDAAQIREWRRRWPGSNWGAATGGGIIALDIDVKSGKDGGTALAAMIERHGNLPRHLVNKTPNGGTHHLFRGAAGITNSAGKIAPGFDVRGEGGYICIPPSSLATGCYEWLDPTAPIPDAPEWLLAEIEAAHATRAKASGRIAAGTRNETLFRFACSLRARAMPDAEAWAALQARNCDAEPPLDTHELQKIFANAWQFPPGFPLTDLGNAERLVAAHGRDLRYLPELGWCRWDGQRWAEDRENSVMVLAGEVVRGIYAEAQQSTDDARRKALASWAVKSESRRALDAMVALARSRPEVVDTLERYDTDPMLLGVRNGVVNLATGEFRAAERDDRMMRQAAVDFVAGAAAPRWEQFLAEIFADDAEMVNFMARALGYSITGSTAEQVMFVAHGTGANGKSVFINVLRRLLGDYAKAVQPETLMARDRGGIPNDIARLRGARFVPTVEIEDGKKMAESLVKQLTGGDAISARFMRQEFFEFTPVAKVWIATNHRPVITGTDYAIWRRILLVPFGVTIPVDRRDRELEEKLLGESSGILNWLIAGCRQWRERGLAAPQKVLAATAQYQRDMDRIGLFLEERTVRGAGRTRKTALYAAYRQWCEESGVYPVRKMAFHQKALDEHGLVVVRRRGYEFYDGLLLIGEDM
jgi:putative DNA primase/helicase